MANPRDYFDDRDAQDAARDSYIEREQRKRAEEWITQLKADGLSMRDLHRIITRVYDAGTPKKAKP